MAGIGIGAAQANDLEANPAQINEAVARASAFDASFANNFAQLFTVDPFELTFPWEGPILHSVRSAVWLSIFEQ